MIHADLPRENYAYGVLGVGPPILMYQIGSRETRILIDIPNEIHRRLETNGAVRHYIRQRILPVLPSSVQPSLEKAIQDGRLRSMPNAWMRSTRNSTPGLLILGDAANMRHSMTGAGMTVALKDVLLLAELLSPEQIPSLTNTDAVLERLRGFHWKRKRYSASLNILAQALYLLFVSEGSFVPELLGNTTNHVAYYQCRPGTGHHATRLHQLRPSRGEELRRASLAHGWRR